MGPAAGSPWKIQSIHLTKWVAGLPTIQRISRPSAGLELLRKNIYIFFKKRGKVLFKKQVGQGRQDGSDGKDGGC